MCFEQIYPPIIYSFSPSLFPSNFMNIFLSYLCISLQIKSINKPKFVRHANFYHYRHLETAFI